VESSTADQVRRLAALLEDARPMPFMRNRVRVDKQDAEALIDAIEQAPRRGDQDDAVIAAAENVRVALRASYPVPFTYEVRIAPTEAQALARGLLSAARLGS
jgi:hypothetical protein